MKYKIKFLKFFIWLSPKLKVYAVANSMRRLDSSLRWNEWLLQDIFSFAFIRHDESEIMHHFSFGDKQNLLLEHLTFFYSPGM